MSETYGYDEMMADFALLAKYIDLRKAGMDVTSEQQVIFNAATDRLNAYDAELKVSGNSIWKWWDPDSYVNYDPHVTVIIGEKREVTGVALNVAEGLGEALMDLDKGIYNTVAHPIDTAKNLGYAIRHPIDTGQALYDRVSTSFKEDVIDGNTDTRARFGARAVAELGLAFVGTKGLDKAAKTLRVSKGTAEVLNTLDKGSRQAVNISRDITKASEIEGNLLTKLKNDGTIPSAGRSGGGRPLSGTPNSYVKTEAGHTLVYDAEGRLAYDISSERVKMTVWDKAPNGNMYPRDVKLEGVVPEDLLK